MAVTLITAFVAGVVSFLAPCVLPLIPGFLAYLAGQRSDGKVASRRQVFLASLFFVLGFSLVFALLGVLLNTVLSAVAGSVQTWLSRIGGVLIIFFGLYLTGLIKIESFEREHKIVVKKKFESRYLTAFVFGLAFAAGWTPCVGPVLGAILGLATSAPGSAFSLLLAYALGLGLPFLVLGLFTAQANAWITKSLPLIKTINLIFGIILIALGILVFTERLTLIASWSSLNNLLLR